MTYRTLYDRMTPDCPTCVPSSADVLARGVRDTGTKNRGVTSDGIAAKRIYAIWCHVIRIIRSIASQYYVLRCGVLLQNE